MRTGFYAAMISIALPVVAVGQTAVIDNPAKMTLLSDGLYGRETSNERSYVAFSAAGQQSLLQKLRTMEAEELNAYGPDADATADNSPLNQLIAELSSPRKVSTGPHPKISGSSTGDCTTGAGGANLPQVQANTTANFTNALARALILTDSTPPKATTNITTVSLYDRHGNQLAYQTSTTSGETQSYSSVSVASGSCEGLSHASVSCPSSGPIVYSVSQAKKTDAGCDP